MRLMAFAVVLLLTCLDLSSQSLPARTQPTASQADMVQHEIAAVQFIGGGSPLSAEEKQECAAIVAAGMKRDAAHWTAGDNQAEALLEQVKTRSSQYRNSIRESWRYAEAFIAEEANPEGFREKVIIDRHDPVLYLDRPNKRLVTEVSLGFLKQQSAYAAQKYKFAPPRADFDQVIVSHLRGDLSHEDSAILDGIAHVEADALTTALYFDRLPAEQQHTLFVVQREKVFHNMNDPELEQWELAEAAGMLSRFAARNLAANGSLRSQLNTMLQSQNFIQNQLYNSSMMGNPMCNVATHSYGDRYGNGCIK